MMKHFITVSLFFLLSGMVYSQEQGNNEDGKKLEITKMQAKDFIPEIHGTIKAKYEYQPKIEAGRFEVRNARFGVTGNVLPFVAYKAEIDLSDEGSIKMLDAYSRIFIVKGLDFTIGQMRVPFTIDAHRGPSQQYFANRSFIAKQVGNIRDVGATLGYQMKEAFPFVLEAGLFNGTGLTNQKVWQKTMTYSVKAQLLCVKNMNLTLSMQAIEPEEVRIHMYDAGLYYKLGNFHIEGEYLFKHYQNNVFKDVHAVNSFVNYDLKLPKVFNKISFLARYDMMTDHSNGVMNKDSKSLIINDYARHRVTGGITLSLGKAFLADIRINYEKYFYRSGGIPKESEQDKIVFEVMTRF